MRICIIIAFVIVSTSCQKETEAFRPDEKFSSIFDNPSEGMNYNPIDVIQTQDGGYLVLASSNNNQVFVLKASARGEFVWSSTMSSAYVNPIGNIIQNRNNEEDQLNYYFVASTLQDATAVLVEVKDLEQTVAPVRTYTSYRRPLAFGYLNPDNYLLLTNNDTVGAVLSKIQTGFAMEWARAFDELQNANANLDAYLTANNPQFFVGAYNNGATLYFNSLRQDGLTFTYTNDLGIETGKIVGEGQSGINSINAYTNGTGAFNYTVGNNGFFTNQVPLSNTASLNVNDLNGELQPDRQVSLNAVSNLITLTTTPYLLSAFTTEDGRIKLSFYDSNGGEITAIDYLGGNDPLEVVKIISTEDQGLVILAKTILGGVKERINLFKIPREELVDFVQ